MRIRKKDCLLYLVFSTLFFWDLIERHFPKLQFVILLAILILNINKINRYITKNFMIISILIFLHGFFNIIFGNNNLQSFLVQYCSILVCYLCFSYVVGEYDSIKIISVYWKTAFIMSLFGVIEILLSLFKVSFNSKVLSLFINVSFTYPVIGPFPRIASLCNEPSFLGYFLAPSVFLIIYSLYKRDYSFIKFDGKVRIIQACIIFIIYLMTFSTVSYIGIIISFVLIFINEKFTLKKIMIPIISVICVFSLYTMIPDFRMRIDDTYKMFFNDVTNSESVNLSTYTFYANSRVAKESIISTSGFGTGLGSYKFQFDKYNIGSWGYSNLNLNREDGNSMLFRIPTELGIIGIISVFLFLVYYAKKSQGKNKIYAMSLATLFLMTILRMGNYTHGGIWLYICLYVKLCDNKLNVNNF